MKRRDDDAHLVYSTQRGRVRQESPRASRDARDPRDGVVRVRREVKGRRGKSVTTISGIPLGDAALRELAAELKRACGSGGCVKDAVIEIQGDHCDALIGALEQRGYRVKRAGG